jgi:hypothetical protein
MGTRCFHLRETRLVDGSMVYEWNDEVFGKGIQTGFFMQTKTRCKIEPDFLKISFLRRRNGEVIQRTEWALPDIPV